MTGEWWLGGIIYEIYPRSFFDSNNDGIGDLPGIRSRLSYIKRLGVDAIWIAPFFASPMADFGYDISDYRSVDKVFGTMQDFKDLLAEAHTLGLRVLIDLVLSHTSVEHPWFIESQSSTTNTKSDWYVWAPPRPGDKEPNGWLSVFGGSAWTWNDNRRQFYLHHFLKEQPQLNLYNPEVRAALFDVARFWLDLGVDGFRLDAVDFYMHDRRLTDNPPARSSDPPRSEFARQDHQYDMMMKEPTLDFIRAFRKVLDDYAGRVVVGEISSQIGAFTRIGSYTGPGLLHAAYALDLARGKLTPDKIIAVYDEMIAVSTESCMCWNFSNHDTHRTITRHVTGTPKGDAAQARMFALLRQFLPGMDCLFQGEELGLPDALLAHADRKDPVQNGRDESRTPIPWRQTEPHGGFSRTAPWLPVPPEHLPLAVDAQEKNPQSLLFFYSKVFAFKQKHSALRNGKAKFEQQGSLLRITRINSEEELSAIFNFGHEASRTAEGAEIPAFGFKLYQGATPLSV